MKIQLFKNFNSKIIKVLGLALAGILALGIAGVFFVKYDTGAAAEITDKYLRPLLGDRQVIFLEKIYFNSADAINRLVYNYKKPLAPLFSDFGSGSSGQAALQLNPIFSNPAFKPLKGEGVWHDIPLKIFPNQSVLAYTFVRPDSSRSFAIVSLVQADVSALKLGSVAGTVEPGGKVGKYGHGHVPKDIVQAGTLVAAFDGGFQYKDGAYGMIVGNTTYLPLKDNLGTVVGHQDGRLEIINYTGQNLGNDLAFVRQNGPLLIQDGQITVSNPASQKVWGRVVGSDIFTWRSGIGLNAQGNLIFAAGNSLNPQTLAQALQMAGAVNAIQLDINPHWVRFNIFNYRGNGQYDSVPLNQAMPDGSKEYLHGYQKDFFYLYKK